MWRFLGGVRDRIPFVGPLLRRVGYGLTLGYVWVGLITALIVLVILIGRGQHRRRWSASLIVLAIGGSADGCCCGATAARVAVGSLLADGRACWPARTPPATPAARR